MIDAQTFAQKYGGKVAVDPPVDQDFYYPGSKQPPPQNPVGIPTTGNPVPEGAFVQQVTGRGMAVVPPKEHQPNLPAMALVPPQASNRTSIGTFVEQPNQTRTSQTSAVVSPTATNPLVPVAEPPKPAAPKKKELDLAKEILTHIWELGGDKSAEAQQFYDRGHDTLLKWIRDPATIPLGAITKWMARKPGIKEAILEQLEPHFAANGEEGWTQSLPNRTKKSVLVCAPILGQPTLPFLWVCVYLAKKYELGFDIQSDTMIGRSRNMLAHRFLASGATWSLWLDADMAAPIANPAWYRWITNSADIPQEYTNYDVLGRLEGHGKAFVGGVYSSRRWRGRLVVQPEINPRNHEDRLLCNEIRRGTARGLFGVEWIGFGCALVHREVFLEVQRNFNDIRPVSESSPWRFFQPRGDEGEDEAFCQRARQCQIPIWLDTQLVCPHIGNMAFLPEHTAPVMAL